MTNTPTANIVTLQQVRDHLQMPAAFTKHDAMLSSIYIPAADKAIARECDEVVLNEYDEYYDGGDYSIWLRHKPVLSVLLVEEGWGWTNYQLNYVQVNTILPNETNLDPTFAYSIDMPGEGKITRRAGGNVPFPFIPGEGNIHVVYMAGRSPIEPGLQLAELNLIAHWYFGDMQRAGATTGQYGYDALSQEFPHSGSDIFTSINYGVPFRIIEMLKPWRRAPIIG